MNPIYRRGILKALAKSTDWITALDLLESADPADLMPLSGSTCKRNLFELAAELLVVELRDQPEGWGIPRNRWKITDTGRAELERLMPPVGQVLR